MEDGGMEGWREGGGKDATGCWGGGRMAKGWRDEERRRGKETNRLRD